jgi:phosphatidylglycerophosphate synthase
MLDSLIRPRLSPVMDKVAVKVSQSGLTANQLTLIGFAFGFIGCFLIGLQLYAIALVLILIALLFDGLDGAVARASAQTELGIFLDMITGVILFAAFPFFFMLSAPEHSMAAGVLLFAMLVMGMINLSYDFFAMKKNAAPAKGGLVELTEITLFMILCCLWPVGFSGIAAMFALMCLVTGLMRFVAIIKLLKA